MTKTKAEIIREEADKYVAEIRASVEELAERNAQAQIDIASAIMRIRQCGEMIDRGEPLDSLFWSIFDRLRTCDLPRLDAYVTSPEIREYLVASGPMADFDSAGRPVTRGAATPGSRPGSTSRTDAPRTSGTASDAALNAAVASSVVVAATADASPACDTSVAPDVSSGGDCGSF